MTTQPESALPATLTDTASRAIDTWLEPLRPVVIQPEHVRFYLVDDRTLQQRSESAVVGSILRRRDEHPQHGREHVVVQVRTSGGLLVRPAQDAVQRRPSDEDLYSQLGLGDRTDLERLGQRLAGFGVHLEFELESGQ